MTIRDLWHMWYDWHSNLEVHVYKGAVTMYVGIHSSMSEEVLNAKVYKFVMASDCLLIFIMENEDE